MTVTQSLRAPKVATADGPGSAMSGRRSRGHRAGTRLWVLLNAQALLNGTAGTLGGGGALSEDDRWRTGARRAH